MPATNRQIARVGHRDLVAVIRKINVVRRLALPDRQNHIDALGEHFIAVLIEIAQRLGVTAQRARADAENKAPLRQMIEHRRVRGEQHRMLLRQIRRAGAELDGLGVADQCRQK